MLLLALAILAQETVPPAVVGGVSALGGSALGWGVLWHLLTRHIPKLEDNHKAERMQLSEQNRADRDMFLAALHKQAELHRTERAEFKAEIIKALDANAAAMRELAAAIRDGQRTAET